MTRVVSATEFKAKCSAILSDIEHYGKSVTITKRGVPVAVLGPAKKRKALNTLKDSWADKMEIVGDIVNTDWSDLFARPHGKREP